MTIVPFGQKINNMKEKEIWEKINPFCKLRISDGQNKHLCTFQNFKYCVSEICPMVKNILGENDTTSDSNL